MATTLGSRSGSLNAFWKDTLNAGKSAVSLYFRPLYWITNSHSLTASRSIIARRRYEVDRVEVGLLSLIKASVCFNQGALIEYSFLVAEKHKAMKTAFASGDRNVPELKHLTTELMNYLNRTFFEITFKNFDFMHSYFSRRGSSIPRVCIKGTFKVDDRPTIISIFRDKPVKYDSDTQIEDNSGFNSIRQNGRFFIENNLPEAVLERNYVNPRLNTEKIKNDAMRGKGLSEISRDWKTYWLDHERANQDSFYKSTLIVPLTLWNNDLSPEFKKLIRIENIERFIFGFLCFDHREVDYFDLKVM